MYFIECRSLFFYTALPYVMNAKNNQQGFWALPLELAQQDSYNIFNNPDKYMYDSSQVFFTIHKDEPGLALNHS